MDYDNTLGETVIGWLGMLTVYAVFFALVYAGLKVGGLL